MDSQTCVDVDECTGLERSQFEYPLLLRFLCLFDTVQIKQYV